MANENKKAAFCPNCQSPAVRSGDEITCERCDATYKITKTGAAKVRQTGRLESIEQRLGILEEAADQGQEPGPEESGPEEPGPDAFED